MSPAPPPPPPPSFSSSNRRPRRYRARKLRQRDRDADESGAVDTPSSEDGPSRKGPGAVAAKRAAFLLLGFTSVLGGVAALLWNEDGGRRGGAMTTTMKSRGMAGAAAGTRAGPERGSGGVRAAFKARTKADGDEDEEQKEEDKGGDGSGGVSAKKWGFLRRKQKKKEEDEGPPNTDGEFDDKSGAEQGGRPSPSLAGPGDAVDLAGSESTINLDVPMTYRGRPVELPHSLSAHLADTFSPPSSMDKPLFWHVPRSGGSTLKDVAAFCLGLVQASEVGGTDGHGSDTELGIVEDVEGARYVNVDTTTPEGLAKAREFRLAQSPAAQLVVTPYLHEAAELLFDDAHRGKMFALIRNPIDRAASLFHYLRQSKDRASMLGGIDTLDKYAKSTLAENNWMTRFLSNRLGGELTPQDEAVAKEVLRTKCLIGLLSRKNESVRRFELYFGWKADGPKAEGCHERLMTWDWPGKNKHPEVRPGTRTYELLEEQNTFDLRLYAYAEKLWEAQGAMFEVGSILEEEMKTERPWDQQ